MTISAWRASASSGSGRPSSFSARTSRSSSAASSRRLKTSTDARLSTAPLSSKDGFSVVAPTSVMVPSSMCGRKLSCCARLKRWISSMNSSVPLPCSRRALARSKALRRSCTPEKIAESCSNSSCVSSASRRATVVLPEPGGPHRMRLGSRPLFSMRVSVPSGPTSCSWPTTSDSFCGRSRSASGRGAPFLQAGGFEQVATSVPIPKFAMSQLGQA